jgi:hypothetical protein
VSAPYENTYGVRHGCRVDYLRNALDYEHELTPAENRRRIAELRARHVAASGSSSSLPGQAPNAGASAQMRRDQRVQLKGGLF